MSAQDQILEANLRALFARAYVPVQPSAAFRARLVRECSGARPLSLQRLLAAAVLLVALGALVWFVRRAPDAPTRESILARGSSAVRFDAGPWRALDDAEAARGVEAAHGALELAQAPERALERVWLAQHGSVRLESAAQLVLDQHLSAPELRLAQGRARIERLDAGEPWRVHAAGVELELASGALQLELRPAARELVVELESGRASYGPERVALAGGRALVFREGLLVSEPAALEPGAASSGREALAHGGFPTVSDPPAPLPADAGLFFSGRLRSADGAPWRGAFRVVLLRDERLPEVSQPIVREFEDAEGSFRFPVSRSGRYTLFALVRGQATIKRTALDARRDAPALELVLEPGVSLRGRVVDAASGAPLAGATVLSEDDTPAQTLAFDETLLPPELQARTQSDAQGNFVLERLSAGRHTLRASAPGHAPGWSARLDARAPSGELVIALAGGGTLEVELEPPQAGAIVVASAIDYSFQRPCLSFAIGKSDAHGRLTFEHLPEGPFVVLRAEKAGPVDVSQTVVHEGATSRVQLGQPAQGHAFSGRLLDAEGAPLADFDLMLEPTHAVAERWKSTRTDAQGHFAFQGLVPAEYALFAGQGLGRDFVEIDRLTLASGDLARDVLLPRAEITGRTREASSGAPLGACWLVVHEQRAGEWSFAGKAQADADGRFRFRGLRPGTWRVTAFAQGERLAPVSSPLLTVRADDGVLEHDLALPPGAALTLTVHDAQGQPLAGVEFEFLTPSGEHMQFSPSDISDGAGQLVLPGLAAGTWTIRAHKDGYAAVERTIQLAVDQVSTVELLLPPRSPR